MSSMIGHDQTEVTCQFVDDWPPTLDTGANSMQQDEWLRICPVFGDMQ